MDKPANATAPPRVITLRSILIGTVGAALICGLSPYNDLVLSDSPVTAGFLPVGAVVLEFLLIIAINAPLHRLAPRRALTGGELAVITAMMLVACALPSWGLTRFLIPTPVAYFYLGSYDTQFWSVFSKLNLPGWLFPVHDIAQGRTDPVVLWFYTSLPDGESLPWAAWAKPLAAWGVFAAAMLATLLAMARLVMHQWMTNERLPFPLVQVHAALIEPPERGRALNALFRSRLLWFALAGVFAIHLLTILNAYFPKNVPRVPLGYDFTGIWGAEPVSGQPLSFLDTKIKKATISFIFVGVTYFIRSRAAFSLWGAFFIVNLVQMQQGMFFTQIPTAAWADQHLGACVAFFLGMLWIGRHHWLRIVRNALWLGGESTYRLTFWVAVAGVIVMFAWLLVVGVTWWVAGLIIAMILLSHLVVARVVAETGMPSYRSSIAAAQIYSLGSPSWVGGRDVFMSGVFTLLGPVTTRDSIATFATQGFGLGQQQAGLDERRQRGLGLALAWAVVVGAVIAGGVTLWCHYNYPTPIGTGNVIAGNAGNNTGAVYFPKRDAGDPLSRFGEGNFVPRQHNGPAHMAIGFGTTALLEIATLRWANWPLLPVGYVASHGAFIGNAWFSIFIGWLAKVLIVRFGGASLFQSARPLFVGIIFGEALAAGLWLIVNAIVVSGGGFPQPVKFGL